MPDQSLIVQRCLARLLETVTAAEEELGRLDAVAGDGDHGAGMVRGFRAAAAVNGTGTASQLLIQAGTAFGDAAGGASGALFGMFMTTVGQSLPADSINALAVHHALEAGLAAIGKLGKAKPGEKTMLDTLDPFVRAFGEAATSGASVTDAWSKALPAAEQGMRSTADMISKRGRAARLGERGRGHVDPGAMSMFYSLRTVGATLAESDPAQEQNPAIIFDFGGVLIDWNPRHLYRKLFDGKPEAMESFLTEIGFSEWNLKQDAGRTFAEGVAELSARFPQYADLIRTYNERWRESIVGIFQPTVDILYTLKQAGYPLYGLSNWPLEKFQIFRPECEFFNWFDDIMISGDVKLVKPDPRIFTLLLERIGRPAKACLLVDDSEVNIIAADRLGFQTIWFKSPQQLESALLTLKLLPQ